MKKMAVLFILCLSFSGCGKEEDCNKKPEKKVVEGCKGPTAPSCNCVMEYIPVCGCDNQTYSNACAAVCAGVQQYTQGACPQ